MIELSVTLQVSPSISPVMLPMLDALKLVDFVPLIEHTACTLIVGICVILLGTVSPLHTLLKRSSAGVGGVNGLVIVTACIAVIGVELPRLITAAEGAANL